MSGIMLLSYAVVVPLEVFHIEVSAEMMRSMWPASMVITPARTYQVLPSCDAFVDMFIHVLKYIYIHFVCIYFCMRAEAFEYRKMPTWIRK